MDRSPSTRVRHDRPRDTAPPADRPGQVGRSESRQARRPVSRADRPVMSCSSPSCRPSAFRASIRAASLRCPDPPR